ncbi:MAG: DUF423 domain-containing protein [Anaerolineaceae bacterium]|nr:DUF423 domain-containing protein [Anaerolineaceae bacterium]
MSQKMERFTPAARRVLSLSQEEAERLHHSEINIGHLLLAFIRLDKSATSDVLHDAGAEIEDARKVVRNFLSDELHTTKRLGNAIELSGDLKKVLEFSVDEARSRGHMIIAPEHLLLGLVRYQEKQPELFDALELDPKVIQEEMRSFIQAHDYSDGSPRKRKNHSYDKSKIHYEKEAIDMTRQLILIGGIVMALGVALGAFGAHGLEATLKANDRVDTFHTGTYYHLIHGMAIFIVAWLSTVYDDPRLAWAGYLFLAGVILFSGSLYVLSISNLSIMGAIAPIGGAAFIIGWVIIAWVAWTAK